MTNGPPLGIAQVQTVVLLRAARSWTGTGIGFVRIALTGTLELTTEYGIMTEGGTSLRVSVGAAAVLRLARLAVIGDRAD